MAQSDRLGSAQIAIVATSYDDEDHENYSSSSESTTSLLPAPTKAEQLFYMEQMALDMKIMADKEGFETLSGIFDMAHREAQLRRGS